MVPSKAFDGIINVRVDGPDGKPIAEHTFEEEFKYTPATVSYTHLDVYKRQGKEDCTNPSLSFSPSRF